MDVKVESQKENKLLGRKEIVAVMTFAGPTPKRADIKNGICSKLGLSLDAVSLRQVTTRFGAKQLKAQLHAYKDVDTMKRFESRHILARDGLAERKPKKEKKKGGAKKPAK